MSLLLTDLIPTTLAALLVLILLLQLYPRILFTIKKRIEVWRNHLSSPPANLDPLCPIRNMTEDNSCIRILGMNPGAFTLQGTNTYIVGSGKTRILIDAGAGMPKYLDNLKKVMEVHEIESIEDVLVTHGHYDHIGGIPHVVKLFPNVRVWKYYPTSSCNSNLSNNLAKEFHYHPLKEGQEFCVDGASLQTVVTPGHTNDHVSFYWKEAEVLFSGDCILGSGSSCTFQDLGAYMKSLEKLLQLKPRKIFPGHGNVLTEAQDKIQGYQRHRLDREGDVLRALQLLDKQVGIEDLVEEIYPPLPAELKQAAGRSLRLHLEKLEVEERVVREVVQSWFGICKHETWAMKK